MSRARFVVPGVVLGLVMAAMPARADEAAPAEEDALFVLAIDGPGGPRSFAATMSAIDVGRGKDNQVVLADPKVGAHHAWLEFEPEGTLTISDRKSKSGTWVNDKRIAGPTELQSGDVIKLGDTTLTVTIPEPPLDLPPHIAGPAHHTLPNGIELDLPAGAILFEREVATKLIEAAGNDSEGLLAMVQSTDDAEWTLVLSYRDVGHVSDHDANDLDAGEMLTTYR